MKSKAILVLYALMLTMSGWTLGWAQGRQRANKSPVSQPPPDAPAGFDNKSNGVVDDPTHQADQVKFDEVEGVADGLGPLYNAQSCRECHQNPTSGGASQITELRVGHLGPDHRFLNPDIPIAHGAAIISGRTLVNDRAICPNAAFPDTEIQERVPDSETIRTTRISLSLLGDGFVEAVSDRTLTDLARNQCMSTHGKVCGLVVYVPIVEAPGQAGIGRFGWKDQHSSLLSFIGDAYLNEMGVTNRLRPKDTTTVGKVTPDPEDVPDNLGLADIDHFAQFVRGTKVPPRDSVLAANPAGRAGQALFETIGCNMCHIESITTAPAGTVINGGTFVVPDVLGNKIIHPFSDFLLHDVGTGDGIVQNPPQDTANKLRTAALWGLRMRPRYMHDLLSLTLQNAIERHKGEAEHVSRSFRELSDQEKQQLFTFLNSL